MPRYASALAANPHDTYRSIDIAGRTTGADPYQLVALLYEELIRALRAAARATAEGRHAIRSERVTRATAILFALESGLDFAQGGEVSHTLARLYQGVRATVIDASIGRDPAPFEESADTLEEIAEAWRALRR